MFSRTKDKDKKHYCMSCLQSFTTEEILSNHKKQCLLINGCQAVNYKSGIKKITNYNKKIAILFKIYADIEWFLKRIKIEEGKDCINKFITWVLDKQTWTQQVTKQYFNKRLIMTREDKEIFNNSQICWICKQELNMDKVRDHCHIAGRFRGAAHSKCNINLRIPRKLPIIFHNLQGYDGHLIFKELNNFNIDIDVISKGIDKYMSIIVNRYITFIDSRQFYNRIIYLTPSHQI